MSKINLVLQLDKMDCGPACLKMISKYYGKDVSLEYLREICNLNRNGVSLLNLQKAAEQIGFKAFSVKAEIEKIQESSILPVICFWNQEHYIVLYKVKRGKKFFIADPAHGLISLDMATFKKSWISGSELKGVLLILEPTSQFSEKIDNTEKQESKAYLIKYLLPYRKHILQLLIGMIAASFISLLFPLLTRLLVDIGIQNKNLNFVLLIVFSQIFLFLGDSAISIIRSWLLLYINTRISLNIISDFLGKLLKLPLVYFETKTIGDISQRINDHHRIENFLTGSALTSIFSILNIIIFLFILSFYSIKILLIFVCFSVLGLLWVYLFQNQRKKIDYKRFNRNKESQDKLFEMIHGMQEIKLYGSEVSKKEEWKKIQLRYYSLNIKSLKLEQYQLIGFSFFTQIKNILISYLAAKETINSNISLGMLLSISYILGQTNSPIEQLITFIKSLQDAQLSMERLQEIHRKKEEIASLEENRLITFNDDIDIRNVTFHYEGVFTPPVLKNITFTIPKGKVTAIVGSSGSGKTTLLKLLLGFYTPNFGYITVNGKELTEFPPELWRKAFGTVMQNGYIFSDTIAKNIALDGEVINEELLKQSVRVSNLKEFIEELPFQYDTKLGNSGMGLSGGQIQRILIARAIYKDPNYLFFDEATSSLDANNEAIIMSNLKAYFKNRTVVIVAHRLSTVKNADQIIVLEKGVIVEAGNHEYLTSLKGVYYTLVKNQLDLGE